MNKNNWLDKYNYGSKIPNLQQGGIIQDNEGYRNPDNWGKPVQINSNRISMKGINTVLKGISDTGDMQMLYPNGEYQFDGNSVIELPIVPKPDWKNWDGMVEKKDGTIGMWGNPIDSIKVKNSTLPILPILPFGSTDHRGVRTGQKYQGTPATTKLIEQKEKQLKAQSSRTSYKNGGWLSNYN